jgi:hypothetical protein
MTSALIRRELHEDTETGRVPGEGEGQCISREALTNQRTIRIARCHKKLEETHGLHYSSEVINSVAILVVGF